MRVEPTAAVASLRRGHIAGGGGEPPIPTNDRLGTGHAQLIGDRLRVLPCSPVGPVLTHDDLRRQADSIAAQVARDSVLVTMAGPLERQAARSPLPTRRHRPEDRTLGVVPSNGLARTASVCQPQQGSSASRWMVAAAAADDDTGPRLPGRADLMRRAVSTLAVVAFDDRGCATHDNDLDSADPSLDPRS